MLVDDEEHTYYPMNNYHNISGRIISKYNNFNKFRRYLVVTIFRSFALVNSPLYLDENH